jgi:hypothetical protein
MGGRREARRSCQAFAQGDADSELAAVCLFVPPAGQSYLFVGDSIPWALPWVAPPFSSFVTQKGLEESWPRIIWILRAIGVVYFLSGLLLKCVWDRLEALRARVCDLDLTRQRRGPTVHSKITSIEKREAEFQGDKGARAQAPWLWLLALIHVVMAATNRWLYVAKPWGTEFTLWCTSTAAIVHVLMATNLLLAQWQANRMCKTINEDKVD